MEKLFIGNFDKNDLLGKVVLVRVDFNVPLKEGQNADEIVPSDTSRIRASLPTIQFLIQCGAKVVLCSHLGRPRGKDPKLSLEILVNPLKKLIGDCVTFVDDCVGDKVDDAKQWMKQGDVLLLENLRFHGEEKANDAGFSKRLGSFVNVFVNDAFGSSHRAHASTVGVTHVVPQSCAGFLMKKELDFLGGALTKPKLPLAAIVGGAKVSTKLAVLKNLLHKVDSLLVGGAMVYTFYRAMGHSVGDSLVEEEFISNAGNIITAAKEYKVNLVLASDSHIVLTTHMQENQKLHGHPHASLEVDYSTHTPEKKGAEAKSAVAVTKTPEGPLYVPLTSEIKRVEKNESIPAGWTGVDIGPNSITAFCSALELSGTVLWNGPLGVCEKEEYAHGTISLLHFLSGLTESGCTTIICGGDTVGALEHLQDALAHSSQPGQQPTQLAFSHVSTGGGAALEFLEGNVLPGVEALDNHVLESQFFEIFP